MKRREVVAALVLIGALPGAAAPQATGRVWRIGFLATSVTNSPDTDFAYAPFRRSLGELGYVQGRNLTLELRSADGRPERLPGLAADLVARKVDVIVAVGTTAISAAQQATATIPIVMATAADPVASGFVQTLSRPGGNITGLSNLSADLSEKLMELLRELVPRLSSVGVLVNSTSSISTVYLERAKSAASRAGLRLLPQEAQVPDDLDRAFAAMTQQGAGAVIVSGNVMFTQHRPRIVELARRHRLPAMYFDSVWTEIGGLMSYGPNRGADMRRVADYVDRILKGARPESMPVEQPTKLELVVNGRTAQALGLRIPPAMAVRIDRMVD